MALRPTAPARAVLTVAQATVAAALLLLHLLVPLAHAADSADAADAADAAGTAVASAAADPAAVERGRAIYRTGARADGSPIVTTRPGFGELPKGLGACIQCHRPSGLGDREARLLAPPLAGDRLFEPLRRPGTLRANARIQRTQLRALDRPAYTMASLAMALRGGTDGADRPLNAAMPRYGMSDGDVADLVAYLRQLGEGPIPGAQDMHMHLATVITPDADPAVARTIEQAVGAWARHTRLGRWTLHWQAWRLQGPPEGWRAQLEARWARQPVFALVSGAGGDQWGPVDAFCERQGVACLLPSIRHLPPAVPGGRHFNVYYSGTVQAEAGIYVSALRGKQVPRQAIINCAVSLPGTDDTAERAGARALQRALSRLRQPPRVHDCAGTPAQVAKRVRQLATSGAPADRAGTAGQPGSAAEGPAASDAGKPAALPPLLMLWGESEAIAALTRTDCCGGLTRLLSAHLAPPHRTALPADWATRARWLSVQADATHREAGGALSAVPWGREMGLTGPQDPVALAEAHAATFFFTDALALMRDGFSTDYLLERLEMAMDLRPAGSAYYRLSLGPNRRVAAQHGRILALNAHTPPRAVPVSPLLRAPMD